MFLVINMSKQVIIADLDETLIRTVFTENEITQQKSDILLKTDKMAIYYRPYLFDFLIKFVTGEINM